MPARRLLAALLTLVLGAAGGTRVHAEDEPTAAERAAREARAAGRATYRQSVAWIRGTGPALTSVRTAHLRFADVKLEDQAGSGRHHEGHLELWFADPDRFREVWRRHTRDTSPTVKLLTGNKAWIRTTEGEWKRQHGAGGTGGGNEVIAQMQRDARQLADLARFLAPASLDGGEVTWTLEGRQRLPAPLAPPKAAPFQRVRRTAPGEPTMLFFFAPGPASEGVAAGWTPRAVGIQADPERKQRAEWFVLDRWKRHPDGRARPARIRGFAAGADGRLARFILLFPETVEINRALPAAVFQPKDDAEREAR